MALMIFAVVTVFVLGVGGPLLLLWKDGLLKK